MAFFDEQLYFYYISLKTGFVSFGEYIEWLHGQFLTEASREVLLDLELCSGDVEKTIDTMYGYLFDKISTLNYWEIGKEISKTLHLKNKDDIESLREISEALYKMWCLLPPKISEKTPFLSMVSINDPWSWGGTEQEAAKRVVDSINWISHYYD